MVKCTACGVSLGVAAPASTALVGINLSYVRCDECNTPGKETCGLCGKPADGFGMADDVRLCHPDDPNKPDCYHLWTAYGVRPVPTEHPKDGDTVKVQNVETGEVMEATLRLTQPIYRVHMSWDPDDGGKP